MASEKKSKSNLINFPGSELLEDEFELYSTDLAAENGEDGDGDEGEGGKGGTTGPLIDPAIFGLDNFLFLELLRQEERKFSHGWVPVTQEPRKENTGGGLANNGPPPHPLLSKTSRFSGDDRKLNANPQNNDKAAENYQELRPSLTPSPQPQHVAQPGSTAPKLRPSGQ